MSQNRFLQVEPEMNFNIECPISGKIMEKPVMTSCGHTFEEESIKEWINRGLKIDAKGNHINNCPCCPQAIIIPELRRNYEFQAALPFLKKQMMENNTLKAKIASLELAARVNENKDVKQSSLEKTLHITAINATAINQLQHQQQELIAQRKALIANHVPAIKTAYKKLALVTQRINAFVNKVNDIDLSDLELDAKSQVEKYKNYHQEYAKKVNNEIIDPYLKKLEALNHQIGKNENDLRALKSEQVKNLQKSTTRARIIPALSLTVFGGISKLKHLKEAKKPVEVKLPEKPIISTLDRAKQTQILMDAIVKRDHAAAMMALQKGANPNFTTNEGTPFIIYATKNKNVEQVAMLLDFKANVNICDSAGETALHWAAYANDTKLVFLLLENGIDPRIMNSSGKNALGEVRGNALIRDTIAQSIMDLNAKERAILKP